MMMRNLLACALLVGCSSGSLDLDGEDPASDPWRSGYSLNNVNFISMHDLAERGYALYSTSGMYGEPSTAFSDYTFDQVAWPMGGGLDVVRGAVRDVPRTSRTGQYYCETRSQGPFIQTEGCPSGTICGDVRASGYVVQGPTPCPGGDGPYGLIYNKETDQIAITSTRSTSVPTLLRRTFAYDGAWKASSKTDAPGPLVDPVAQVSGAKILVFGGAVPSGLDGGLYDPGLDQWTKLAEEGKPKPSGPFRTVWTGEKLVVIFSGGGAVFDPLVNAWRGLKAEGAPDFGGGSFVATYDPSEHVVYVIGEGQGQSGTRFMIGQKYDLDADEWQSWALSGGPAGTALLGAAWTGTEVMIWGGTIGDSYFYFPQTGAWATFQEVTRLESYRTASSTDRVYSSLDGNIVILPAGIAFDPKSNEWTNYKSFGSGVTAVTALQEVGGQWAYFSSGGESIGGIGNVTFPRTPSSPIARQGQAFAVAGDYVFSFGGCSRALNDHCQSFTNDAAVVRLQRFGAD